MRYKIDDVRLLWITIAVMVLFMIVMAAGFSHEIEELKCQVDECTYLLDLYFKG